jgi:hypothetical protein
MAKLDHLIVGAADLDRGIDWVAARLGVRAVPGGSHAGFGTRNALVGLGDAYLEILALDPEQTERRGALAEQVAALDEPALINLAIAAAGRPNAFPLSPERPDGLRLESEIAPKSTPLIFIDWKDSPHPSVGLPDGGRITSITVTTPDPATLRDLDLDVDIEVREGPWHVEATIDGRPLA